VLGASRHGRARARDGGCPEKTRRRRMEVWVTEAQTDDLKISLRVRDVLHHERTDYQELTVVDTVAYGRMLLLDTYIQTTERDEFIYHEMISHVPLFTHPNPRRVVVVGGGDGGTV